MASLFEGVAGPRGPEGDGMPAVAAVVDELDDDGGVVIAFASGCKKNEVPLDTRSSISLLGVAKKHLPEIAAVCRMTGTLGRNVLGIPCAAHVWLVDAACLACSTPLAP